MLRQSLDAMRGQLQDLGDRYDQEREEFERLQSAGQSQLQRLSAEYNQTRQSLEQLRTAFDTLERVSSEHALVRARLETVVADRDGQLNAQAASHLAAELAGQEALAGSRRRCVRPSQRRTATSTRSNTNAKRSSAGGGGEPGR